MDILRLKYLLVKHEGVEHTVYNDSLGIPTIGVGRNLQDKGLSDSEIDLLLQNDINDTVGDAVHVVKNFWCLNNARQEVIVNMIFNLGITRFKKFKKTILAIENNDFVKASIEMLDSKWAEQVGPRAIELSKIMKDGHY